MEEGQGSTSARMINGYDKEATCIIGSLVPRPAPQVLSLAVCTVNDKSWDACL